MKGKKYNCRDLYDDPNRYSEFLDSPGYLIYLFTNTVNNKHYVGDTTVNLRFRLLFNRIWKGHFICYDNGCDKHLYNAMRKYGLDKFTLEIIYQGEYIYSLEGVYIDKYDSFYNGYNDTIDGKSFKYSPNALCHYRITNGIDEKLIKPNEIEYWSDLGWYRGRSDQTIDKMLATQIESGKFREFQRLGTESSRSPESKAKMVATQKSNPNYNELAMERVRNMHTPEAIERSKLSRVLNGTVDNGNFTNPEVKEKIAATLVSKYGSRTGMMLTESAQRKTNEKHKWLRPDGTYYIGRTKSARIMMNKRSESWVDEGIATELDIEMYYVPKTNKTNRKLKKYYFKLPNGNVIQKSCPNQVMNTHPDWEYLGPVDQLDS